MKKLLTATGACFALIAALVFAGNTTPVSAANGRDCDSNAVIKCGTLSVNELQQKYTANEAGDLESIFAHYGISKSDITNLDGAKMGRVYKDGRVVVDGKEVATNARTVGREDITGSTAVSINGKTYYERTPSVSFRSDSIPAIVIMEDGVFKSAIITSCGNPVVATPAQQPKKPTPAPEYDCESLTVRKISRNEYRFTTRATATNGAEVSRYVVDFGDGTTSDSTDKTVDHTYAKAGDYTAKVTTYTTVNSKEHPKTNEDCEAAVKVVAETCPYKTTLTKDSPDCVKPAPAPVTVTPCPIKGKEDLPKNSDKCKEEPVEVVEIPKTGPAQFVGAGLGISSLTAAGYYWSLSRRNLISKLLNK